MAKKQQHGGKRRNAGRRKFVKPLFAAMVKTDSGKIMAKEIYSTARGNYHSITQQTIDSILVKR